MSTTTQQPTSSATSDRFEGPARSAAYLVTRDTPTPSQSSPSVLDEHGRLSSAGAATSLKHARAQDLPSFPSQGGVSLASAGAAASLAESNKKPFEHWKPGELPAANKAALQAKDYEMDPLWKPEMSRAGSKAAALAHRDNKSPDAIYKPMESEQGASAAGYALDHNISPGAITQRQSTISDHRKALMAATGAMAGSRRRSGSAPMKPAASTNTTNWALQAATASHRPRTPIEFTTGDPGFEAARVQNLAKNNVNRQMYGSAPPVAIEVQEKNRQDMLKASAVAMARKQVFPFPLERQSTNFIRMYAIQQQHIDEAKSEKRGDNLAGARAARNRSSSEASASFGPAPLRYENLEEAARRLAQERLAKLHDEHAEYRQYYGATQPTSPTARSKLSKTLSMRNRRRTNSYEDDSDDSDAEQSRRIRSQMSIFQSKLAEVDTKKRQADRDALLVAAHKNVTKQMNAMDERVFSDTGKASPQQREMWERQARERAQRDSDERMVNVGKVHIGGGKYLDQSEIDAIAKARLQPTLDDISEKAEAQRARDEELRLEQERLKAEADKEKQRQAEIQQGLKETKQKEKDEERARKAEEKRVQKEEAAVAKEKRQAEAAEAKEKSRLEKEGRRKAREDEDKEKKQGKFGSVIGKTGTVAAGAAGIVVGATIAAVDAVRPGTADTKTSDRLRDESDDEEHSPPDSPRAARESQLSREPSSPEAEREQVPKSPTSLTSPPPAGPESPKDSRVRSWFKSRFRSTSKTQADDDDSTPNLVAGPAAPGVLSEEADRPRSNSMRDVALAGRTETDNRESDDMYGDDRVSPVKPDPEAPRDRSLSISSMSSYGDARAEQVKTTSGEPQTETEAEPEKITSPETSRISTEQPPSESEGEGQGRGRRGFRARILSKVRSVKDKNRNTSKGEENDNTIKEEPTVEQQAAAIPDAAPLPPEHNKETDEADKQLDGTEALKIKPERKDGKITPEEDEEARDNFVEETLAPPPKLSAVTSGSTSPKGGSRERSKFTEDL